MSWRRLFPFLQWPRPSAGSLRQDALAGVSIGLVVIPQSLAYATLAGMPPVTGLYAALLPCVLGILWGSSPLLVVGPVALTSLLTFAALQPLAAPASADWIALAIWLALYAGVIQLVLGGLRLGLIANFVTFPVMAGFINAAALIIILSQLPALLGLPTDIDASWLGNVADLTRAAPRLIVENAVFGLAAVALLVVLRRFLPLWPGVLLVCIAAIVVSSAIGFAANGGAVVGAIPSGVPELGRFAALDWELHRRLLPAAIVIALISFTEAMGSCKTLAHQRCERWDVDQELIGQGLAKIASATSGAFPVSGSLSRSALNAYAGGTSGWSSLFAAACVLVCLLWATHYLYHLPLAVLAAIVIVPALGLIDFSIFSKLRHAARDDGVITVATFAITILSVPYVHWGVFTGFVLSLFCFLYRRAHPRLIEVGVHPDGTLRDRALHRLAPLAPDVLALRMDAAITYISAPVLERFVMDRIQKTKGVRQVLLCGSPANDIDATGVETLRQLHRYLDRHGIALRLSGVKKQVREILDQDGLSRQLGEAAFFSTDREAIEALAR